MNRRPFDLPIAVEGRGTSTSLSGSLVLTDAEFTGDSTILLFFVHQYLFTYIVSRLLHFPQWVGRFRVTFLAILRPYVVYSQVFAESYLRRSLTHRLGR
jgi:hypothetical protein